MGNKYIKIHSDDNVVVALENIVAGELLNNSDFLAVDDIAKGHKIATCDISESENIIKYGYPIGYAIKDIKKGGHVHTHNIKTNLSGKLEYTYTPQYRKQSMFQNRTFNGYKRENGTVGIRNEIWIIPTVGCVNHTATKLAQMANNDFSVSIDGVFAYTHPYGCSQLGGDHALTQKILAGLVSHPNAAGILVLGLGCENNNIDEFKKILGGYDPKRVKFLVAQDVDDEIEAALDLLKELYETAKDYKREEVAVENLVVGLKCGGSDGFSGITGNPLVGRFSDKLISYGASSILTEVPEMFGAESILMNRCESRIVYNKTVSMINDFKGYYERYNMPIYENPSPGNKKGGISTLEEKSLGCTQKSGDAVVVDVLKYGEGVKKRGLSLLTGPGNDIVAQSVLTAAQAHIILFTTGRGTPLGAPVPTIKISTNTDLFNRKPHWMDFDSGELLETGNMEGLSDKLLEYVISVANGENTNNEKNGYREIAIFKDGVTL